MAKRVINMGVLPGEPLSAAGRVCIHLFVQDDNGPFIEPHALHLSVKEEGAKGQVEARPTRGRLACDPSRLVAPVVRNGVTTVTPRSDDPRAVTCPKCKASVDYDKAMELLETKQ